jgi:soluble lytic murein transglycosylase-like protein
MLEDVMKLLLSEISKLSARITYLEQQNKTLSRMVSNLLEQQKNGGLLSPEQLQEHLAKKYALPGVVSFCNERIPLDKWDVWERLDSEFLSFLVQEKQVFLWLKRGGRYFPLIEEELAKAGLPDDLKYIAIIESGLRANAKSHAGAVGFWQFIQSTGDEYGLEQNAWLDNRRNFYASTQAAIKYLKKLYGMFHDWPLALAAYNCGEGRVLNAMKSQGVHNYYQLELPRETERYVFKIILSDPQKYGFYIGENNIFPPHKVERIKIQLKQKTHLRDLAKMYGSYYREFRLLNPEIRSTSLPAGTYTIKVPLGWQTLAAGSPQSTTSSSTETISAEELQDGSIIYTVKSGDSLSKIARKFNVSVNAITKLEGKTKSLSMIYPGEKLLILKK